MKKKALLNKIILQPYRIILTILPLTLHTQSFAAAKKSEPIHQYCSSEFTRFDETKIKINKIANSLVQVCVSQAIIKGQRELVQTMLEKDHLLYDQKDSDGRNLLHIAIKNQQPDIAKHLIEKHPILLNQKNRKGWTPLHTAAKAGCLETTRSIIEANCQTITQKTKSGIMPIHLAAAHGHIAIVNYIDEIDPNSHNQKDAYDQTPLHMAAALGHLDIVESLLTKHPAIDFRAKLSNGANIYNLTPEKIKLMKLLKNFLFALDNANPDEKHLECGICMENATDCPDCQYKARYFCCYSPTIPAERICLTPCCLMVLCTHDYAILMRKEEPKCPYCRRPWTFI